jgi:hypothetical protein
MSKITRAKLARGAKLLVDHIFTPLTAAQNELTARRINADQVQADYAPFRVNLSIPRLSAASNRTRGYSGHDAKSPFHGIPFMLPPLQEHLSFTTDTRGAKVFAPSPSAPEIVLDEVSFSFDQRLEPAAIVSNWDGGAGTPDSSDRGKLSYERASRLNIGLTIMEKKPTWFEGAASTNLLPGRVVWSGQINSNMLTDGTLRLNPWVSSGINEVIDPLSTYIFSIYAPDLSTETEGSGALADFEDDTALVSIEISMRFLAKLMPRDAGATIQNIPYRHLGNANQNLTHAAAATTGAGVNSSTARPLITSSPSAGDEIVANDATGVQTSMAVIDEITRRKLQGGYKFDSDVPMLEELAETAGYSVIAVPLFNNLSVGGLTSEGFDQMPYVDAAGGGTDTYVIDRRYIPIEAPMTIHHVLFTYSWMPFTTWTGARERVDTLPAKKLVGDPDPTLNFEVGVGIGTGMRTERFDYQPVAHRQIVNPLVSGSWYGATIDRIQHGLPNSLPQKAPAHSIAGRHWNLELHAMDLVGSGSPGMNGMTAQGKPIFVGRSTNATASRTNIANAGGTPGASAVAGQEQWIEVRGRLGDSGTSVIPTQYAAKSMLLGSGGIWVYIIGKTHLV